MSNDRYRDEWRARRPFEFWCHLDDDNREKLTAWAQVRFERVY